MTGGLVTIDRFGASAPAPEIYQQLGITSAAIVASVHAQRG
jgi:transketolase